MNELEKIAFCGFITFSIVLIRYWDDEDMNEVFISGVFILYVLMMMIFAFGGGEG